MEELGRVIQVLNQEVLIQLSESAECKNCNLCSNLVGTKSEKIIRLPNTIQAKENDMVIFGISESKSIILSALIYLFPLIMAILGYFAGEFFGPQKRNSQGDNPIAILFSLSFLIASFFIIYVLNNYFKKVKNFLPYLIRVHETKLEDQ